MLVAGIRRSRFDSARCCDRLRRPASRAAQPASPAPTSTGARIRRRSRSRRRMSPPASDSSRRSSSTHPHRAPRARRVPPGAAPCSSSPGGSRRPRSCSATPSTTRPRRSCCAWPGAAGPARWRRWPRATASGAARCSDCAARWYVPAAQRRVCRPSRIRRTPIRLSPAAGYARRCCRCSRARSARASPSRSPAAPNCCGPTPTRSTRSPRIFWRTPVAYVRAPRGRRLNGLAAAVRSRVLRTAALQAGCPPTDLSAAHVAAIDALVTAWKGQGPLSLPGGVTARARQWNNHLECTDRRPRNDSQRPAIRQQPGEAEAGMTELIASGPVATDHPTGAPPSRGPSAPRHRRGADHPGSHRREGHRAGSHDRRRLRRPERASGRRSQGRRDDHGRPLTRADRRRDARIHGGELVRLVHQFVRASCGS